jgi:hypothetical protein
MPGTGESHYFTIELTNATVASARDVRFNGLPLWSVEALVAPGRLQFIAEPATLTDRATPFRALVGQRVDFEIAEAGFLSRSAAVKGTVTSVDAIQVKQKIPAEERVTIELEEMLSSR